MKNEFENAQGNVVQSTPKEIYHLDLMDMDDSTLEEILNYFVSQRENLNMRHHDSIFSLIKKCRENETNIEITISRNSVTLNEIEQCTSDYILDEDSYILKDAYEIEFTDVEYENGKVVDKISVVIMSGIDRLKPFVLSTWAVPKDMKPSPEMEYTLNLNALSKAFPGYLDSISNILQHNDKLEFVCIDEELPNKYYLFDYEVISKMELNDINTKLDCQIVNTMKAEKILEYIRSGSDLTPQDARIESMVKQLVHSEIV